MLCWAVWPGLARAWSGSLGDGGGQQSFLQSWHGCSRQHHAGVCALIAGGHTELRSRAYRHVKWLQESSELLT